MNNFTWVTTNVSGLIARFFAVALLMGFMSILIGCPGASDEPLGDGGVVDGGTDASVEEDAGTFGPTECNALSNDCSVALSGTHYVVDYVWDNSIGCYGDVAHFCQSGQSCQMVNDVATCVGSGTCTNSMTQSCSCPGSSSNGTQTCTNGAWGTCTGCSNTACANGESRSCSCPGSSSNGTQTCTNGAWGTCSCSGSCSFQPITRDEPVIYGAMPSNMSQYVTFVPYYGLAPNAVPGPAWSNVGACAYVNPPPSQGNFGLSSIDVIVQTGSPMNLTDFRSYVRTNWSCVAHRVTVPWQDTSGINCHP